MNGHKTVTATFVASPHVLTINVTGSGSVAKSPDQPSYPSGTQVTLTATPAAGWHFVGWSGDQTGSTNPVVITMNSSKTITATFEINTYTLTVNSGANGSVTKDPNQPQYDHGTQVELTAIPAAGHHFAGWGGGASGTTNPLIVTMNANKTISASFASGYTITILTTGDGSVTRNPNLASYTPGQAVQLTAVPVDGAHHFVTWTHDVFDRAATNPITVNVDSNMTVGATFTITESVPPVVQVVSPNGGELLAEGQTATLRWTASDNDAVAAVNLYLSRTGAAGPFETIALALHNSGSYDWIVNLPASTNAFLKVTASDANGNLGIDLSNAAFTILASTTGIEGGIPAEFGLARVFPNPVSGPARIAYDVPFEAPVRVSILDLQGREVAVLEDGVRGAGRYAAVWDGRTRGGRAAAGVYFARLEAAKRHYTRRFALTP